MKFLIAIAVVCMSVTTNAQESMFFAAGQIARGADLFMGASPNETHFVSTQVEAFEAVPNQPYQAPKPVPVQAPQYYVQSPKQAPTACQPMVAYHRNEFRRQAPERRDWFERRSERRSARVNRGGFIRGLLGC